jgi:hypothetical protein
MTGKGMNLARDNERAACENAGEALYRGLPAPHGSAASRNGQALANSAPALVANR